DPPCKGVSTSPPIGYGPRLSSRLSGLTLASAWSNDTVWMAPQLQPSIDSPSFSLSSETASPSPIASASRQLKPLCPHFSGQLGSSSARISSELDRQAKLESAPKR